jgi:tetratricopeptide (TPR) repeat protein
MKTITFYSYKGGVGRSLALSNIARRLSELRKKVCIIDFDLDAPGLQFKFSNHYHVPPIQKGLVDYIYQFNTTHIVEDSIQQYVTRLQSNNQNCSAVDLIPAGNIYNTEYWKKLSMISWADMFYADDANGIQFFLDLKHKIETELQPDFLLIDSRTGITDISGITLRLFADEAVILAVNNDENIFGSKMIIKNLLKEDGALFGVLPKINFVLTRVPFTDTPEDKTREQNMINQLTLEFKNHLDLKEFHINVIHSDRRLEEQERQLIGYSLEKKAVSISNDYLKLFDSLTAGLLSDQELSVLHTIKTAEREYNNFLREPQLFKKVDHLNKAIKLDPQNYIYLFNRAGLYTIMENRDFALRDYLAILKYYPENTYLKNLSYQNIATIYAQEDKFKEAIEYLDKLIDADSVLMISALQLRALVYERMGKDNDALKIHKQLVDDLNTPDPIAYNYLADHQRSIGNLKEAYSYIRKAIAIKPEEAIFYATLAEINEAEGDVEGFFLNFTLALSKNIEVGSLKSSKDVYLKYEHDPKMVELLGQYNLDFEAIKAL